METICTVIRLKPDSVDRVREWARTLNETRRDETLATLRDEGVMIESAFLWRKDGGNCLFA